MNHDDAVGVGAESQTDVVDVRAVAHSHSMWDVVHFGNALNDSHSDFVVVVLVVADSDGFGGFHVVHDVAVHVVRGHDGYSNIHGDYGRDDFGFYDDFQSLREYHVALESQMTTLVIREVAAYVDSSGVGIPFVGSTMSVDVEHDE